jgi:ATP-dependent exoDNAse (exonuclease V) beta subunit
MTNAPDIRERLLALDPRRSFIVQAPAGSGKTELLIQRYLALLAGVEQPEAVVAITFTRKAAAEMRRRVSSALEAAAGARPEEAHQALTWELASKAREQSVKRSWELARNPGRLRIQTIDALCASLTHQMPWLSRLGGAADIIEDAGEVYAEAARRTVALLEDERWGVQVGVLLRHLDNDFGKVQRLLAGMLARRDQWLRHIAPEADAAHRRGALEAALRCVVQETVEKARVLIPEDLWLETALIAAAAGENLISEERPGRAAACAGQTALPAWNEIDRWMGIVDTLLTREDTWRKSLSVREGFPPDNRGLKQRAAALISRFREDEALRLALLELRHVPDLQFAEAQWQVLQALLQLLPLATAQLQDCFRAARRTDYVEVALGAQRALGEPDSRTDLALSIDCRIQHLLIDEFQDTSVSQYALLERLTAGWKAGDGRTFFAVGDPMQSIYRFREAEVGLFLKASREGIGGTTLERIGLTANFRSDKGIVDWVNQTFAGILPAEEDIATGAIPYAASEAVHAARLDPAVVIHPFIGPSEDLEAARVVELVRSARDRGMSAAILVRARNHANAIVPALQAAGLKFRAVEMEPLADLPVIQDLTALTRALLHPADRIAWLALLRAPWCGLTLEELHRIAGDDPNAAIWALLRDEQIVQALAAESQQRLNRVRSVLESALRSRPFSLRSWVEGVWIALGGPACTRSQTELQNAGAFFEVLEEADEAATPDSASLQRRIRQLYAKPDSEADESLQLMTIHKAKGLQFDVVVVPALGRTPRHDDSALMRWLERPRLGEQPDLLLAPISATGADGDATYEYLKRMEGKKSEHEARRLLYVAATRAKSELHLLGHASYTVGKEGGLELKPPASGSLLAYLWPAAEPEFRKALDSFVPRVDAEVAERRPQPIQRLVAAWRLPAPAGSVVAAVADAAQAVATDTDAARVSFDWVGNTLRHVGTVVHQMLRHIAEDGSAWDAGRIHERRPAYLSALATLGVPADELAAAVDRVETALVRTIGDERGKWLLGMHDSAACEQSICGVLGDEIVSLRIDRTFVDEHGTRWVVDYKSSSHEGAGLDAFLDNERERYREQMNRYRRLFANMEDRPLRTALYFPLLTAWREIGVGPR